MRVLLLAFLIVVAGLIVLKSMTDSHYAEAVKPEELAYFIDGDACRIDTAKALVEDNVIVTWGHIKSIKSECGPESGRQKLLRSQAQVIDRNKLVIDLRETYERQ